MLKVAKDGDGVVKGRGNATPDATTTVGFREQEDVEEVGVGFESLAGPVAERAIGIRTCHREVLDEPMRAGSNDALESLEPRGHRVATVNREAHIVGQRCGKEFLVGWALLRDDFKNLKRVLKGVTLGMAGRVLPDRFQDGDNRGKPIEPVSDDGSQRP